MTALRVSAAAVLTWAAICLAYEIFTPTAGAIGAALLGVFATTAVIEHRRWSATADAEQVARIVERETR